MTAHDLDATKEVLSRHRRELLARPGVTAVGIGFARTTDDEPGSCVVRLYVDPSRFDDDDTSFPTDIEGIPVEIESFAMPSARDAAAATVDDADSRGENER